MHQPSPCTPWPLLPGQPPLQQHCAKRTKIEGLQVLAESAARVMAIQRAGQEVERLLADPQLAGTPACPMNRLAPRQQNSAHLPSSRQFMALISSSSSCCTSRALGTAALLAAAWATAAAWLATAADSAAGAASPSCCAAAAPASALAAEATRAAADSSAGLACCAAAAADDCWPSAPAAASSCLASRVSVSAGRLTAAARATSAISAPSPGACRLLPAAGGKGGKEASREFVVGRCCHLADHCGTATHARHHSLPRRHKHAMKEEGGQGRAQGAHAAAPRGPPPPAAAGGRRGSSPAFGEPAPRHHWRWSRARRWARAGQTAAGEEGARSRPDERDSPRAALDGGGWLAGAPYHRPLLLPNPPTSLLSSNPPRRQRRGCPRGASRSCM